MTASSTTASSMTASSMTASNRPIPRRISFYWHGGPLSFCRWMTLKSFRHYNPRWEMRLYRPAAGCHSLPPDQGISRQSPWETPEQQDFQHYFGADRPDYSQRIAELGIDELTWPHDPAPAADPVQQSDLFQWRLLHEVGGFYADLDILWLRPIEPLYQSVRNADAMMVMSASHLAIGFLASKPGNPFFRDVLAAALSRRRPHEYQSCGIDAISRALNFDNSWLVARDTRPKNFGEAYRRQYPGLTVAQPPDLTVYPWPWSKTGRIWRRRHRGLSDQCYGIHWYAGAPLSQQRNCELTESNLGEYQCTWAWYARQVLVVNKEEKGDDLGDGDGKGLLQRD